MDRVDKVAKGGLQCVCVRCAHEWKTRRDGRPSQCPKCHDSRWDMPRVIVRKGPPGPEAGELA
jgi:DNA-directed RNA polymerase subunit RPC12/RpoP